MTIDDIMNSVLKLSHEKSKPAKFAINPSTFDRLADLIEDSCTVRVEKSGVPTLTGCPVERSEYLPTGRMYGLDQFGNIVFKIEVNIE